MNLRMRAIPPVLLGLGWGAALLMAGSSHAAPPGSMVGNPLSEKMRLSAADLRALDAGSAVIKSLDTPIREELDAAGILFASLLAIHYGKLPSWYLAVGLARYAFVLGIAWRRRHGNPVVALDPNRARRILAGVQMGYLSVALWPPIPAELSQFLAPVFGGATSRCSRAIGGECQVTQKLKGATLGSEFETTVHGRGR